MTSPIEDYLADGPAHERPVVETLLTWLKSLGPVTVEPGPMGLVLEHNHRFAELRPMSRWVAVWFVPVEPIDHPRIARRVPRSRGTDWHVVNVAHPDEIDVALCDWLAGAYAAAG